MVCLRSLSNPEQWTFTVACDPRCIWGVRGIFALVSGGNYVSTCMCWHVAVRRGSVPGLEPRMSEAVCCVAWVVAIRSSSCLAAYVHSWWCRQDGCWHCAGCCCVVVACSWALYEGSSSVVKLLGGRGAIVVVSSKRLVALCSLLVFCDCVFLGLCMRGSSSVVKLLGGRGAIVVVSSRRLMALCILLL